MKSVEARSGQLSAQDESSLTTFTTRSRELQGCHNILTINPKEHTPNPDVIMENTVTAPYGSRRLKNPNIPNLHMLMKQNDGGVVRFWLDQPDQFCWPCYSVNILARYMKICTNDNVIFRRSSDLYQLPFHKLLCSQTLTIVSSR